MAVTPDPDGESNKVPETAVPALDPDNKLQEPTAFPALDGGAIAAAATEELVVVEPSVLDAPKLQNIKSLTTNTD